jgi:hypothetical protein
MKTQGAPGYLREGVGVALGALSFPEGGVSQGGTRGARKGRSPREDIDAGREKRNDGQRWKGQIFAARCDRLVYDRSKW